MAVDFHVPMILCHVARTTQIKTHAWDNTSVILVGNKCDLKHQRLVDREQGKRLAEDLGTRVGGNS